MSFKTEGLVIVIFMSSCQAPIHVVEIATFVRLSGFSLNVGTCPATVFLACSSFHVAAVKSPGKKAARLESSTPG